MEFSNDSNYLDQHFLIDEEVINNFIKVCNLKKSDVVVEIGPGKGVLSKLIKPNVKKLYLIEKDERLKDYLKEYDVVFESVLDSSIPSCDKIITSLPYSIIEPFIYKLIKTNFKEAYIIMGSSYVYNVINRRITNLSLLTNTFFDTKKYFDIPRESFSPMPNTLSSVIRLVPRINYNTLDSIFRNLYLLDKKKIKNALEESLIKVLGLTKRESRKYVLNLNIPSDILNTVFNLISNKDLDVLYNILSGVFNENK